MSELFTHLTRVKTPALAADDEFGYEDSDIRKHATEVHVLGPHGNSLLAVLVVDNLHVSFALFTLLCIESEEDGGRTYWQRIMNGSGPAGSLRECRHTFWGEPDNGGYIFYPPLDEIAAAMKLLTRWFD